MQILKKNQLFHLVGSVTTLALVTLLVVLLLPVVGMGANAEEISTSASTNLRAVVQPTVSIALDKNASIELQPDGKSDTKSSSVKLAVSTNAMEGYKVLLSAEGGNSNLTEVNQRGVIQSIAEHDLALPAFADNTWGYSLVNSNEAATNYHPIPTTATIIKTTPTIDIPTETVDRYDLYFGAKVNNAIPAGIYTKQMTVSVVANPLELRTLTDLTYMQDMKPEICANTAVGTDLKNPITKQLVDTRDGKKYWVSKLADGNCWMVQNLAYDITEERINSGAINPTNTDVSETWDRNSAYPPEVTKTGALNFDGVDKNVYTQTYSWNLGEYVIATPINTGICNTAPLSELDNKDGQNALRIGQYLSQCGNMVDVGGKQWSSTYTIRDGQDWGGTTVAGINNTLANGSESGAIEGVPVAVKCNVYDANNKCDPAAGGEYDAHYLLGNYYQYNTSTAGTGGENISSGENGDSNAKPWNAPESICPKGWKLPKSGMNDTSLENQTGTGFYLFKSYGYPFNGDGTAPSPDSSGRLWQKTINLEYQPLEEPFYFNTSGVLSVSNTLTLRDLGRQTFYAGSTPAATLENVYYIRYTGGHGLYPSHQTIRSSGLNVRCLVR